MIAVTIPQESREQNFVPIIIRGGTTGGQRFLNFSDWGHGPSMFLMKMSVGGRRLHLAGSSNVEAMALFRYKIVLVPDFAWLAYR